MATESLLQKLDDLEARFREVSLLITDPAVIADMKRFVKLNREYRDLERISQTEGRHRHSLPVSMGSIDACGSGDSSWRILPSDR